MALFAFVLKTDLRKVAEIIFWLRYDSAAALLVPLTLSFHDRRPRISGGRRASMEQFASVNHRAAITTSLIKRQLKAELFARLVVAE